jgi:tellurite methyltransferase
VKGFDLKHMVRKTVEHDGQFELPARSNLLPGEDMKRKICGYYKDVRDDWVAELACFHGQHVRHAPPFTNRPWVETAQGREDKLGMELDCVRCDRFEFPDGLKLYRKTPIFDEQSIPAGLLRDHVTKSGTWALIIVEHGELQYSAGMYSEVLTAAKKGVVVPNMRHCVSPIGSVRFRLEFYARAEV